MRYAYINGYEMAVQFDADGQHLPEYIPELVRTMQETSADVVIGSRYMERSSSRNLRGVGRRLLKITIRMTTGKTLTDPTSGMRLYNRKTINRFANQMNYDPEPDTMVYLMNHGAKLVEIPVEMQERIIGKSYLSTMNAANYMLRMIISIIIIQWFRAKESWN
jgi:glycosyltransferase involved in cell wall biosynthesis